MCIRDSYLASDAMALAGVTDQIIYLEEGDVADIQLGKYWLCLLYTSPSPRDRTRSRMPSSA